MNLNEFTARRPMHMHCTALLCNSWGAELFKRAPEVMYSALLMHNSVIRTAKYANCGAILEQEGDSFTLAFYEALDAVAFCLQAS
jgi:hypothetical protein